jgi:hypothetical protein
MQTRFSQNVVLLDSAIIALVAVVVTPGYLFYFDITPKLIILLAGTSVPGSPGS